MNVLFSRARDNTAPVLQKTIMVAVIVFCLCTARLVYADVIINEIAWMGTATSTANEWIELYNNGTDSVILDGWSLSAADGSPNIALSGSVSAGGYALLERTDDTTVPGITALVIYSGALSNTGEYLTLKNNIDQVVDEIDNTAGWVKGNSETKKTMQRNAGVWITAVSTPGAVNATTDETSPGGDTTDTGSDTSTDIDTGSTTTTTTTPTSSSSSTTKKTTTSEDNEKIEIYKDPTYSARMVIPDIIVAGSPVTLSALVTINGKQKDFTGTHEWSTGDGASFLWRQNKPFTYTYRYPGDYIIQFKYYASQFSTEPSSLHQKKITVIPDTIVITDVDANGTIRLKNSSTNTIDLGGWKLSLKHDPTQFFTFPQTLVLKDAQIALGPDRLRFYARRVSDVELRNPSGNVVTVPLVASSGISYTSESSERNPYDMIPAGDEISLLHSEASDDLHTTVTDNMNHATFAASVAGIGDAIGLLARRGGGSTAILIITILLISALFFALEYIAHRARQTDVTTLLPDTYKDLDQDDDIQPERSVI